jgi:DNA-binding LacI/PurR family transcriptional regulator
MADCLILAGTNYENFTKALEAGGIPYVLLANNFVGKRREPVDQVRFDDFSGAFEATRYLIQLGHRHIWYIGDTSLPWYRTRHQAYLRAMKEAGLPPLAQTLSLAEDRFTNGLKSALAILEQKANLTAILAGTDEVAYGAWEGLRRHGLEVPRDVSIIGFDDHHSQIHTQALTSVRVEAEQVGRELARMAMEKIASKGSPLPEVMVSTRLIKRETCRPLLSARVAGQSRERG